MSATGCASTRAAASTSRGCDPRSMRRTDQRRAAIFIGYQHDVTGTPIAELMGRGAFVPGSENGERASRRVELPSFARDLAAGLESERQQLGALSREHA